MDRMFSTHGVSGNPKEKSIGKPEKKRLLEGLGVNEQ
jgi:hypothetical protein